MRINHPDPKDFLTTIDGKNTGLYLLSNNNGISLTITNYGGRIVSLYVPDKEGVMADIVCGFNSIDAYLSANEIYHGATIGRFANRIRNGRITLDDVEYKLPQNNGENTLHGGINGFHNVVWDVESHESNLLTIKYLSPDMEEGFPGNLLVKVHFELNNYNELKITYEATTDKKTVINLTNHAYFNLAGEGNGDVFQHQLKLNSSSFTEIRDDGIPTGKFIKVDGTPFDFRQYKSIGQDINDSHEQIKNGKGYDHNFLIDNAEPGILSMAARVIEPNSGRKMDVYTTEPAVQFYSCNFFDGSDNGKQGLPYNYRGALALETQHYPDSPHHPYFPTTVLKPGEEFHSQTIFKFGLA